MAILRIKDKNGVWQEIPAIKGGKGDKGDKGDSLTVQNVTESNADGGNNSVVLSDGSTINIKNGRTGTKGADGVNATINGVTALVIEGKNGIGATQNGNVLTLHLTGEGNEAGSAASLLNRSTKVNEADTNYTTLMARGSSLNATEATPTVTGAIYWTYE